MALLYRRPGILVAWTAWQMGVPPLGITLVSLVLAFLMPIVAWGAPDVIAAYLVFGMAIMFQIFDCADGTLARVTDQTSRKGGDLDFLGDMLQWGCLYLAIGLLADRQFDISATYTAIGAVAAWARLFARVVRDRLPSDNDEAPRPLSPRDLPLAFLAGISGLIPFVALMGDWLHIGLWALLIYGILDIAEGALPLLRR